MKKPGARNLLHSVWFLVLAWDTLEKENKSMDKELSKKELEEILASKLRELGMSESSIEYWVNNPEEMVECLKEILEFRGK